MVLLRTMLIGYRDIVARERRFGETVVTGRIRFCDRNVARK